jgi:L-gulonate 5-dehydrogenase
MKVVYVAEPHSLEIREVPVPEPGKGEVLVRVRAGGICGSDMHIYHGTNPLAKYPRIIGHEFSGEVAALGEGVTEFAPGDRVAVDPVTSCGTCYPCSIGRHNVCESLEVFGVHRDGGFAEFIALPVKNLHRIPSDWSFEKGALVEPFTIAANVLSRTECSGSDRLLVLGAGPIGQVILQAARRLGTACAVADIVDVRLEKARTLGAELTVNTRETSLEESMAEWTGGAGVPLIIDAVGSPDLFPSLLRMASPAGRIGLLGFSKEPSSFVQLEAVKKELSIFGSRLNRNKFPEVISWFSGGLVKPELLVSHRFPFERVREAMKFIEENPSEVCKVILEFQE